MTDLQGYSAGKAQAMIDSTDKDQLGLWEKLNRLYGEKAGSAGIPGVPPGAPAGPPEAGEHPAEAAPPAFSESLTEAGASNPVCLACSQTCRQTQIEFEPLRCPKTENRPAAVSPPRQSAGLPAGALGRINETCNLCRRSCKQAGLKINRMLCLGFQPLKG
jgi:hypothetical protein